MEYFGSYRIKSNDCCVSSQPKLIQHIGWNSSINNVKNWEDGNSGFPHALDSLKSPGIPLLEK